MKIVTKLYLKSFLLYSCIFGLMMTLWEYIDEEKVNIWKQVFQAAFFGGLMSWATVTAHRRAIQKPGNEDLTEEDFKVYQTEFITNEKSIQEIFELLKNNEIIKNWKLKIENSKIIGKTKNSLLSWGEKIIITDLKNKIKIESKPILKTTLFDYGKNKENVMLIKRLIEDHKTGL